LQKQQCLGDSEESEIAKGLISLYRETLDCVTGEHASFNRRCALSETVVVRDGI
jgi:hypothetical protein